MSAPRIALVHDWLDTWGGSENVLAEMVGMYPSAELFTLVDFLSDEHRARLGGKRAITSFVQRVPGARAHFRSLLPLFPRAIESLDIAGYDLVISSSHAVAKGVRTTATQLHVCYCHTPMRYAWDLRDLYLEAHGLAGGMRGAIANGLLDRLRDWDRAASVRVDRFVANSAFVRERIARAYGRDAAVIHPPVDLALFAPATDAATRPARDAYVTASRFVAYKRIDRVVAAFRLLPDRRLIVAGAGPEERRIRAAAGPNVEFAGEASRERMRELLVGARAFVFAAEEDFGILPVEAQACGTPVIACAWGGVLETVRGEADPLPSGVFFAEPTAESIAAAVRKFEALPTPIDPAACRASAERFAAARFRRELGELIDGEWQAFAARGR